MNRAGQIAFMTDPSLLHKKRFSLRDTAFAALIGGAMLAGGSVFALNSQGENSNGNNTNDKPAATAAVTTPDLKVEHAPVDRGRTPAGSFAPVVQKVAPSVVEVFVTSNAPKRQLSGADSDSSGRFFGHPGQFGGMNPHGNSPFAGPQSRQRGLGSGVIVSTDGYILTNNHVVQDASKIRVALADGREFTAKVVGTDPKTDVAVVKIKTDNKLPAVTFADSESLAVGDVVLAVGNPFGIGQTVTQGIVSAKDRVTAGGGMDEDFIQTDAAINPGNSGGALVDVEGRLVGINTAILSHSGGFQGVGFAIPSNLAQWVLNSLVKNGRVDRGFLGVSIQNVTPDLVKAFKLDRRNGALVADVTSGSPADNAGLKSGDVIREFNKQPVKDASQLKLKVAETAPGTRVPVQVLRNGTEKTFDVTLDKLPNQKTAKNDNSQPAGRDDEALAGVGVADLDNNVREQVNVPSNVRGAVVTQVAPNSPAYEAGLRTGDVITEINHQAVNNAQDAISGTGKPTGSSTLVKVWSKGASHYLTVDEGNGNVG